ncbi:MAG: hypothetical protein LBQ41_04350 [Candidatus Ancillula sp.]|jgi:hypothetical protein|nr:hypothetical protein [Candidatus Ancillula sp.]
MLKLFKDFWIQSKDIRIAQFSFDEFGFASDVKLLENDTNFRELVDFSDGNIIDQWLAKRLLPMNRENGARLLQNNRLANIRIVASNQYFLSLSDTLWLNPFDEDRKWDEVSLYQNNIDVDLFELALYGEGISNKSGLTPEYTTGGHLAKGWLYDGGIWKLKKGAGYYPGEPLSEVLAYEIAKQLEFNCVKYEYEERKRNDEILSYSSCDNFSSEDFSFLPAYSLAEYGTLKNRENTELINEQFGFTKQFNQMALLDALTFNNDRHYNNFGYMYDSNTGKITDFSPIFDTGQSLFYKTPEANIDRDFEDIFLVKDLRTRLNFIDMLKQQNVKITSETFAKLDISLIGKEFEGKFPERIETIRKAIDIQVGKINEELG